MLISYHRGQTGVILRVKILDSSKTTGAGLTGLTNASTGLIISTIADNESSATAYTVAASHIQTIATLGTYAAPSASNCRFGEVDSTNHKGVYEIQIADARYAVSSAKSLLVSISGATNCAETDAVIPLTDTDPYDAVHGGMSALPNTACTTNASLLTSGTGTDQISVTSGRIDIGKALGTAVTLDANNVLNVSTKYVGGTLQTAGDIPGKTNSLAFTVAGKVDSNALAINGVLTSSVTTVNANIGQTQPVNFTGTGASALVKSDAVDIGGAAAASATVGTVTNLTNAPTAGDLTATMKTSVFNAVWSTAAPSPPTAGSTYYYLSAIQQKGGSVNDGAPTASSFVVAIAGSPATSFFNDQVLVFVTGALAGQAKPVLSYDSGTLLLAVSEAFTSAPANGDKFVFFATHVHPVTQIASGVWQDAVSGDFTVASSIGKVLYNPVPISSNIKKNQAITAFPFLMTDATTHAPKPSLTVTVTRSIDGGAFGAGSLGAVTEIGNGWYYCSWAAADTNGNYIAFRATASGADDRNVLLTSQP